MNCWGIALMVTLGSIIGGIIGQIDVPTIALVTFSLMNALCAVLAFADGRTVVRMFREHSNRPRLRP